jgi:hypothetical protein
MSFWDFVLLVYNGIKEHRTKVLGFAATTSATLILARDTGLLEGLATPEHLKYLALLNLLLGAWTARVGYANTTAERIAQSNATIATAEATTASKMDDALHTRAPE